VRCAKSPKTLDKYADLERTFPFIFNKVLVAKDPPALQVLIQITISRWGGRVMNPFLGAQGRFYTPGCLL
jgi:hypothetical protein